MFKGLILFAMLLAFYPLPVALVVASLVRLALGWHGARRWIVVAALAPMPQAVIVLVAGTGLFARNIAPPAEIGSLILAGVGLVAWWRAVVRPGAAHYWLEPVLGVVASVWLLAAVSSWIAH